MLPYDFIFPYMILALLQIFYLLTVTPLRYSLKRTLLVVLLIVIPVTFASYALARVYLGPKFKNLQYVLLIELPLFITFTFISKRKFLSQTGATLTAFAVFAIVPIVENLLFQIIPVGFDWVRIFLYPVMLPLIFLFFRFLYRELHDEIERFFPIGFLVMDIILLISYSALWVTFTQTERREDGIIIFLAAATSILVLIILIYIGVALFIQRYKNAILESHDLAVTESQFESLNWQIQTLQKGQEKLAIARHDMRHSLTSINALLNEGDTKRVQEYIKDLVQDIDTSSPAPEFSKNILINSIATNYVSLMKKEEIKHKLDIANVPVNISLNEMELCVFLCNAIENAIKATLDLPVEKRYISIKSSYREQCLLLTIENTFDCSKPISIENLDPLSSTGIGLYSMQNFAQKYGVILDMKTERNVFILRAYFSRSNSLEKDDQEKTNEEKSIGDIIKGFKRK